VTSPQPLPLLPSQGASRSSFLSPSFFPICRSKLPTLAGDPTFSALNPSAITFSVSERAEPSSMHSPPFFVTRQKIRLFALLSPGRKPS
jgi:hypothetical protein